MSRFNSEAYDKLFPRVPDPVPAAETAVEKFTPTKDKLEGRDPDKVQEPDPTPEVSQDPDPEDYDAEVEVIDGDGKHS